MEIVKNYGVSFGQSFWGMEMVVWFTWCWLLIAAIREKHRGLWLAVVGGGLNLGERWWWGYVVDYWRIPGTNLYNNLNDWLIFIGFGWYLFDKWQKRQK